ncbi:hypothetical protein D5086_000062 [Populus alba]|uniref:Uncharacterized protein n=1 Tax=Populus alba TaxID=43335 RepID=A0ACC4CVZ0_POPAL
MVVVKGSVSINRGELERTMPITGSPLKKETDAFTKSVSINNKEMDNQPLNLDNHSVETIQKLGIFYPTSPEHKAAVRLQKVYKSYRTRRILADCAVLVDQSWYVSVDLYKSWLDVGEGKEVNLEACPRSKFQKQCIKYLGPTERKAYEVVIEQGKLLYKMTGELVHTTEDAKSIFVLDTSKTLYVGKKKKGTFQHSSFLAGGVTTAAGRLIVETGILKAVWPHSGHYWPTEEKFQDFLSFLRENNVDLTDVETSALDEEDRMLCKRRSIDCLRSVVGLGPSGCVSIGICLGFQAQLVLTHQCLFSVDICIGFQTWLVSTNFKLDLPWFSSSIDNLSWFSSSVDPVPLRAVSVGIDLGFQFGGHLLLISSLISLGLLVLVPMGIYISFRAWPSWSRPVEAYFGEY